MPSFPDAPRADDETVRSSSHSAGDRSPRLRALLVDDERLARRELRVLLRAHPAVEVVGEAAGLDEAVEGIHALTPDVVFLDVQMPGGTGFDVLDRLEHPTRIIFVTAYDHYALRAFEVNALDYLLKPIHPERLANSIDRLSRSPSEAPASERLLYSDRVCLTTRGRMHLIPLPHVLCIRGADDYTEVYSLKRPILLSRRTLASWEAWLPPEQFVRIHRSTIVNLERVASVTEAAHYAYLVQVQGLEEPLRMSRRYARRLRGRLAAGN